LNKKAPSYTHLKIPSALAAQIKTVAVDTDMGYRNVTEFVVHAIRNHLLTVQQSHREYVKKNIIR